MKEAPLEVVKARTGDLAEMAFEAMKTCKEGYMRIQRQWPSLDEPHEGRTFVTQNSVYSFEFLGPNIVLPVKRIVLILKSSTFAC